MAAVCTYGKASSLFLVKKNVSSLKQILQNLHMNSFECKLAAPLKVFSGFFV